MAGLEAYTGQCWFYLPNAFLLTHFTFLYFIDLLLLRHRFLFIGRNTFPNPALHIR
jgi:hypothetical protein